MKLKSLVSILLATLLVNSCSTTTLKQATATPAGTHLYYVTQPQASDQEAQTYVSTFEQMQNYKPGYLVTMMVNEAGAKIQAGIMAKATMGYNYKIICNFNIGNDATPLAQDSFNQLQGNQPEICSGGFAIHYERTDAGSNFHIDYFNQLIPLLRGAYATAPIYLYFNPNQMWAFAQSQTSTFNSFITLLTKNNVTLLWPVYSTANVNNLHQLFTTYPAVQKVPYQILFNLLNTSPVQTQILNLLSSDEVTNYTAAFWEVNSSVNCPVGDTKTCLTNLNSSLTVFPK